MNEHIHTISQVGRDFEKVCCHECRSSWGGHHAIEQSLNYIDNLQAENARLREQADALAAVVQIALNGHYWANNAEQRADPLGYLQSRVEDLADKADTALRAYREWLAGDKEEHSE